MRRHPHPLIASIIVSLAFTAGFLFSHHRPPEAAERYSFALGTLMHLKLYGPGAEKALDESLDRLNELEDAFSVHRRGTDAARINESAGREPVPVRPETDRVLRLAREVARASGGAFDPTVGPLVSLWGIGTPAARIPGKEEILRTRGLVGWRDLIPPDGTEKGWKLARPGQALDLGGIAKGYAGDDLTERLRRRGVLAGLLDLGGNILVFGPHPGGGNWTIGIQDPRKPRGTPLGSVTLEEGTVVTSGVYERFFEQQGVRYHHLLDPATGVPARSGLLSVTVVASSSALADALSTALFVLGPARSRSLLARYPAEVLFVTEDRKILLTPSLRRRFRLTDRSFTLRDLPGEKAP